MASAPSSSSTTTSMAHGSGVTASSVASLAAAVPLAALHTGASPYSSPHLGPSTTIGSHHGISMLPPSLPLLHASSGVLHHPSHLPPAHPSSSPTSIISSSSSHVASVAGRGTSAGREAKGERKRAHREPIYMRPESHDTKAAFKGKVVLMYAREMEGLAKEIASLSNGKIILGHITWGRFPDTFPNIMIENARAIKYAHVTFLTSLHNPEVIFEQLSTAYSIPRYCARSFKVIVPFFPTGTMERIQTQGEIATAHSLARMISAVPPSATGPAQIVIFDIHTLQNQFYFGDNVLIRLKSTCHLLLREIRSWTEQHLVTIAFPDDGAHKRFNEQFSDFEHVVCAKVRDGDKRIVKIKDGEPLGRHVIIVDDLVQSGGTLIECAKALRAAGATHVSAFVAHAIFPQSSWKKFVSVAQGGIVKPGEELFTNFFVTNTHPMTETLKSLRPFTVLSVAPIIAQIITDGAVDQPGGGGERDVQLERAAATPRTEARHLAASTPTGPGPSLTRPASLPLPP